MPAHNDLDLEKKTVISQLGYLPKSVMNFKKTTNLQMFISDEIAKNTYSGDSDVAAGRLSQFNPKLAEFLIKLYSKKDDLIIDPFAGRCRALMATTLGRRYIGYEISPTVCAQLSSRMGGNRLVSFKHSPVVHNCDSELMPHNEEADMIFSCPPYWDVEDYNKAYKEGVTGQLSDFHNYEGFLKKYARIVGRCYQALKTGRFAVWAVADIRRNKTLIDFGGDTIRIFRGAGFRFVDRIVTVNNSPAVLGVAQCLANGYVPKCHEYVLVFQKGGGV